MALALKKSTICLKTGILLEIKTLLRIFCKSFEICIISKSIEFQDLKGVQSTHGKILMEQGTVMNVRRNVTTGHTGDLHHGL